MSPSRRTVLVFFASLLASLAMPALAQEDIEDLFSEMQASEEKKTEEKPS